MLGEMVSERSFRFVAFCVVLSCSTVLCSGFHLHPMWNILPYLYAISQDTHLCSGHASAKTLLTPHLDDDLHVHHNSLRGDLCPRLLHWASISQATSWWLWGASTGGDWRLRRTIGMKYSHLNVNSLFIYGHFYTYTHILHCSFYLHTPNVYFQVIEVTGFEIKTIAQTSHFVFCLQASQMSWWYSVYFSKKYQYNYRGSAYRTWSFFVMKEPN